MMNWTSTFKRPRWLQCVFLRALNCLKTKPHNAAQSTAGTASGSATECVVGISRNQACDKNPHRQLIHSPPAHFINRRMDKVLAGARRPHSLRTDFRSAANSSWQFEGALVKTKTSLYIFFLSSSHCLCYRRVKKWHVDPVEAAQPVRPRLCLKRKQGNNRQWQRWILAQDVIVECDARRIPLQFDFIWVISLFPAQLPGCENVKWEPANRWSSACVFTVCAANTLTAAPSPPSSTCRPGCRWNGRGCWGPPSSFSWSPPRCTRVSPGCRTTSITGATCCAGSCRGPWWPSWWWVARFFTLGGWDGGGGVVCWLEPWIQKMILES